MNAPAGPVLRDIHLPPPPGWWPPAPGWWLLAAILIVVVAIVAYCLRKRWAEQRRRRAVLREFENCVEANRLDPPALAAALSRFLRRMALRDNRAAVAYISEHWLDYLDARGGGEEFRRGAGRVLLDAPFRSHCGYDTAALIALARRWTLGVLESGAGHA